MSEPIEQIKARRTAAKRAVMFWLCCTPPMTWLARRFNSLREWQGAYVRLELLSDESVIEELERAGR